MGPLVSTLNAVDPEINFTDTMLIPRLESFWYLAVSWSPCDNLVGLIETRLPSSSPVTALLPRQMPPDIGDLKINESVLGNTTETIIS